MSENIIKILSHLFGKEQSAICNDVWNGKVKIGGRTATSINAQIDVSQPLDIDYGKDKMRGVKLSSPIGKETHIDYASIDSRK